MVNAKYPALQVDLRPGMFKAALQRAVYHGTVYVVSLSFFALSVVVIELFWT